jgi:hypothetical protein
MRVRLPRIWEASLCLSLLSAGCVTTQETAPDVGSFTNRAPGSSGGEKAESGLFGSLFSVKKPETKVGPRTHLAYAQYEEARGNELGARRAQEEQRGNSTTAINLQDEQRASYAAARKSYQQVLSGNDKSPGSMNWLARPLTRSRGSSRRSDSIQTLLTRSMRWGSST